MIEFKSVTGTGYMNAIDVTGDNIDEIVEQVVDRIRPQSKDFYREYIREELENGGQCTVDVHAGSGTFFNLRLEEKK